MKDVVQRAGGWGARNIHIVDRCNECRDCSTLLHDDDDDDDDDDAPIRFLSPHFFSIV